MDIELAQALAENAKLRKEIFALKADIADLEWQLKEVIADNDSYQKDNAEKDKQIEALKLNIQEDSVMFHKEISELKAQIEKMRNCSNCKNICNGIRNDRCKGCMKGKDLPHWEWDKE